MVIIKSSVNISNGLKLKVYDLETETPILLGPINEISNLPFRIFVKASTTKHFAVQIYRCNGVELNYDSENEFTHSGGYQEIEFILDSICSDNTTCILKGSNSERILSQPYCGISSDGGNDIIDDIDSDSDSDVDSDGDTDIDADIDSTSDLDADSDSDTDIDADIDSTSNLDVDSDSDTDSDSDSDSDSDFDLNIDSDAYICIDNDGDNYGENCTLGTDCDDTNYYIHSGAREICGNGIDEDCANGDSTCGSCYFTNVTNTMGLADSSDSWGATWLDYDNDGDLDLFVAINDFSDQSNPLQDFLYQNNGNSFSNVASQMGITDSVDGIGVATGDYDNDGDLDLFVANWDELSFLYQNNGNSFSNVASQMGITVYVDGYSAAFADYNNDGNLDLFVPDYGQDILYQNNGDSFSNVTKSAGIIDSFDGWGCAFGDYDNDGDLDLFVANYNELNHFLYNNNGSNFTNVATSIGITDSSNGEGVAWGDYDNDGDLDLFIANFEQQDFLYNNNGTNFERVDISSGITDSSDGTGVAWGDYDNDGDLDLFVSNWNGQQDFLYNNNEGSFKNIAKSIGLTDSSNGEGAAWGDYDNDGDLDLFVANDEGDCDFLYQNNCPLKSYIVIRPVVQNSNNTYRDAIGARIYVDLDGSGDFTFPGTIMQEVAGNSSYGKNQLWLQFGLGDILNDVAVKVIFPGPGTLEGRTIIYNNVHINQRVELREDGSIQSF